MSVNRLHLAMTLAKKYGIPVSRAKDYVGCVLEAVTEALVAGQLVEFRDFGTLETFWRKARLARNPRNPQAASFSVPGRKSVRFRPSQLLTQRLNCETPGGDVTPE